MFGFYVCAGDSHSNSHACTASTLPPKHYKTKLNQICHFPTGPFGGLQNRRGEQTCVYVLSATGLGDLWLSQLLKQTLSPFLKSKWYLTARLPWRASKLMDRPSDIFHPLFLILSKQANVLYGFHSGWGSWWKHSHYRLENRCVKLRFSRPRRTWGPSPDLQAWLQRVCSAAWLVGAQRTELWTRCGNNELIENIWTEAFQPLSQSGLVSKPSGSTETHAC